MRKFDATVHVSVSGREGGAPGTCVRRRSSFTLKALTPTSCKSLKHLGSMLMCRGSLIPNLLEYRALFFFEWRCCVI